MMMNSRECATVLLLLVVVGGGMSRYFSSHEGEEGHGGRLRATLIGRITGWWCPRTSGAEKPPASKPETTTAGVLLPAHNFRPMAANLTRCHRTFSDANAPVYCCPPRPDADQAVVDFRLPENVSGPLRVRRPVGAVAADREYLAKYKRAVAIMKSLPPDHPHNFRRQANNHCLYCTGSYDQLNSTALFKIHRSWLFFPWHRAYLYFHERILGKLIGDDTFALPFWNWDAPDGMVIPGFYARPGALNNAERDGSHLPPTVVDDNYAAAESGLDREDQIAANLAFMYHQMVSGAKKAELFMGCKLRAGEAGFCDGPGTIEDAPHNTVHTWVGSGRNPERENMGAFYSAARDPIFYAHHANVDRLWSIWKSGAVPGHGPEFADPDWLDTSFTFYDENLQFRRIRVRDVLDHTRLGYTYQETDLPWLHARPEPAVAPKVARAMLKKRDETPTNNNRLIRMPGSGLAWRDLNNSGDFGPHGRILDAPARAKVSRPPRDIDGGTPEEAREEVLVVYGIEVEGDAYAKFDVFVNLVDMEDPSILDVAGPRSREFAGTFVNARGGARRADRIIGSNQERRRKTTLKLGVSELLRDLEAEEDDRIWVSLVPRGNTGADITVGGVRMDFVG